VTGFLNVQWLRCLVSSFAFRCCDVCLSPRFQINDEKFADLLGQSVQLTVKSPMRSSSLAYLTKAGSILINAHVARMDFGLAQNLMDGAVRGQHRAVFLPTAGSFKSPAAIEATRRQGQFTALLRPFKRSRHSASELIRYQLGPRRVQTDWEGNVGQTCFSLPYGDGESHG